MVETLKTNPNCPLCAGTGEVIINPGMCGGCEVCGDKEERIEPCPECFPKDDTDFSGSSNEDR